MKKLSIKIIIVICMLANIACKTAYSEINFPPPQEKDTTVGQNGLTEEDYWNLKEDLVTIEDVIGRE